MKNIETLEYIRDYCGDIRATIERFGNEKAIFDGTETIVIPYA